MFYQDLTANNVYDVLAKYFGERDAIKNTAAITDGTVMMNIEEWFQALKAGHMQRVFSARAMFKYDINKRYQNEFSAVVHFVERALLNEVDAEMAA
jgi:ribosomal protein L1